MRSTKTARAALAIAIASILAACAVGPDYHRPAPPSVDAFVNVDGAQFNGAEVEREFWTQFNDSLLNELIEESLSANHDVRIAMARLREARALRGEAHLDLAPTATQQASRSSARSITSTNPSSCSTATG